MITTILGRLIQYVIVLDGQLILAFWNDADFDLTEVNHIILRAMDTDSTANDYLLVE
jgi:hypothetical protein